MGWGDKLAPGPITTPREAEIVEEIATALARMQPGDQITVARNIETDGPTWKVTFVGTVGSY